jgi:hypothetical protein
MKKIFDYFLAQLNDNTNDLVYKGNFLFKFFTDAMKVYEPVEGKLVNEEITYRPVSLMTSEDVPFVEDNGRVDWLVEFGILAPIKAQVFDETNDLDYANIKDVCAALNGQRITYEGKQFSFKVSPYPKYRGWDFVGESKYAILTVTMNLTELDTGEYGQDSTWYLDDVALDVIVPDVVSTRRFYTGDKKATTNNDYNQPIGRVKMITLTINYDPDNTKCVELFKESRSDTLLKKTYTLKETHIVLGDFTNNVIVRSAAESSKRNSARRLIVEFVEAVN